MNQPRPRSRLSRSSALRTAAILLTVALTLAMGLATSGTAAPQRHQAGSRTASLYWGAQIGAQLTGEQAPWDMTAVYKFEQLAQKNVSLVGFSAPFAQCKGPHCSFYSFPTEPMQNLRSHGTIPFFSWSSSSVSEGTHDPRFQLGKVIQGKYDHYIRTFARAAAEWGHPFFLRFNWEMNGNWFAWSEGVNGNRRGQFVAAWRHVHDIFTSVGATNATWVWCPNVGEEEGLRGLYPGNKYVDWTCLDGYNWGTRFYWSSWKSFDQVYRTSYRLVHKIAPGKPMVLGEVASTTYGGSKAAWIRNMFHELGTRYSDVHGLVWFDVNDRGTKWPIETSRAVTNAFASGIGSPAYRPNLFGNISASPIPPPHR
jgi:mannan endo-1,4-beta-mannosidase